MALPCAPAAVQPSSISAGTACWRNAAITPAVCLHLVEAAAAGSHEELKSCCAVLQNNMPLHLVFSAKSVFSKKMPVAIVLISTLLC
jgi:hypothetical protein